MKKRIISLTILTTMFLGGQVVGIIPDTTAVVASAATAKSSDTATKVVNEAKKHIGVPYKWGGTSPKGFDCSGFTQYVMKKCGININRTASQQIKNGTKVSKANLKPGDLVFFKNTYKGCPTPSHVGIYIGNNKIIHAGSKGVTTANLNSSYYTEHYYSARRVIK